MPDDPEKRLRFKVAFDFLKRLFGKKPAPPGDPYAYAMPPCVAARKGATAPQ